MEILMENVKPSDRMHNSGMPYTTLEDFALRVPAGHSIVLIGTVPNTTIECPGGTRKAKFDSTSFRNLGWIELTTANITLTYGRSAPK